MANDRDDAVVKALRERLNRQEAEMRDLTAELRRKAAQSLQAGRAVTQKKMTTSDDGDDSTDDGDDSTARRRARRAADGAN